MEEVDAIVDSGGRLISVDVSGGIECQSHLSGIPDLLLTFKDPDLVDDCSFHPCVRYARYEHDQVISFVPPDGNFQLMRYRIKRDSVNNFTPPLYCHSQWSIREDNNNIATTSNSSDAIADTTTTQKSSTGRIVLQVGVTSASSLIFSASRGKGQPLTIEDVAITIPFPKTVRTTADSCSVNMGSLVYDEAGKVVRWNIGKLDVTKKPQLQGKFILDHPKASPTGDDDKHSSSAASAPDVEHTAAPNLSINWKIPLASVSGLSVSGLSVTGEVYRPYKGVRNITKSGMFQVRGG